MKLAIPTAVELPNLMRSEVLVGARVCATDGEARESDAISALHSSKIDECSLLTCDRGVSSAVEPCFLTQKVGTEQCKSNGRVSGLTTEDVSQGLNYGIMSNGTALAAASGGKQIQWKAGKSPRNGTGCFKKPRTLQADNLLHHHPEAGDTKMESDFTGSHLVKCSNADKSHAVKQKNNLNGRRGDRRSSKFPMKVKNDQFLGKAGLSNIGSASGGSNTFGMYGLKPEFHNISKFVEDISLDQLLDGSYKSPTDGKDKARKPANVNENILDSVLKAFSILRLHGLQKEKQTEEMDIHVNKKISLISSHSNINVINGSIGEEGSLVASSSISGKDQGSCNKAEAPANMSSSPLYQPRDIFDRLALPPPVDLDLLLQDAMKPATSVKPTDSRSGKPLLHRVSLPAFPWSHNFNGHCKSNNDATKTSNKSSCQGRWVRVRSNASFTEEWGTEGYLDLDSITCDDTLIPGGQLKYELPQIEKKPCTLVNHPGYKQDLLSAMGTVSSLPMHECGSTWDSKTNALHSPKVLAAAQTLCDMAKHYMKAHSNGIMKWPKQPSQKVMKARKSILGEKSEDGLLTPKSEPTVDHSLRSIEYGTSLKKPKLSVVERSENFSLTPTVIGLCSVSAPRSSRSSPNILSRDPVAENRHCNGSLTKPPSMVPSSHRVLDRSNRNPPKLRKVGTMDWNRARS